MDPATPSNLDQRRVLGDLSPNTKTLSRASTAADFRSPKILFEVEEPTPRRAPVKLSSTPKNSDRRSLARTGQKRKIEQVDGPAESIFQGTQCARDRAEDEIRSVQATATGDQTPSPSVTVCHSRPTSLQ